MTFQRTSHPQTVDINPSVSIDRHPCVFRRNIFDEAFASFLATIKDETFVETLLEPLFFRKTLLAGHGTADMFLVNVLFSDVDVTHFSCTS